MRIISLDIETNCLTPWTPGAEIVSIAYAGYAADGTIKTIFEKGEDAIRVSLLRLAENQNPIIVYNQTFEWRWFMYKFPEIKLNWFCDVMRLVQLAGSSFDGGTMKLEIQGFGLKPAVQRILGDTENWTDEIYEYIRKTYSVNKGQEGKYLAMVPDELLKPYNEQDSIKTLELYTCLTTFFNEVKFDWKPDHELYQAAIKEIVLANLRGFPLDRPGLVEYVDNIKSETIGLDLQFKAKYAREIKQVREDLKVKEQAKFKKKIVEETPEFNVSSRAHLERLFCGKLGLEPKFFTNKGAPSFKSAHMASWEAPGKMLANRQKRIIIQKQVEAVLRVSESDNLFHPELKACGTVTGRFAGASGSNIQGWSRSDKPFMESMQAPEGYVLTEQDFVAGEPTIICAYTNDPVYMYHVFTGVGKAPYYDDDGLMWLADPYIAMMSVSGLGTAELRHLFEHGRFDGLTFTEAWLKDPEIIKDNKDIKKFRKMNKMLALALGYGMGAKKLAKQVKEMYQIEISESDAKRVVKAYWDMYKDVKAFNDKCSFRVKQAGYLVNQFGFRVTPEPVKSFNALIQSTLSGVVNWRLTLLREACDWFHYYTTIHDSLVLIVPEDRIEEFNKISDEVDAEINKQLNWSVKVRTGRNAGKNFYEIK